MGGGGESKGAQDFITVTKHLLAGGVAGAVSRTVVSPLERLKILFQIQGPGQGKYNGIVNTLVRILKEEGLVGYFKGNGTNVIRIAPYSAVQFASYEKYKKWILDYNQDKSLSTIGKLSAGAAAGITSAASTYPLDLVRTRLSAQSEGNARYTGIVHATKTIWKEEGGIFALYRGLPPTLMGVAPYVAINFTVYESLRAYCATISDGNPTTFQKLISGAVAGASAQTVTYPMDVVRRRMQMTSMPGSAYQYNGSISAFKLIYANEGIRGFFKGMIPNYLKVAPAIGVSFVTYEWSKKILNTS